MKIKCLFLCLFLSASLDSGYLFAQRPTDATDASERSGQKTSNLSVNAAAAVRSSPFDPPEDSDHSFSVDAGPGLDTGCSFRSDGPLVFNIEIKRYVGELNPDGTLRDAAALIAAGVISPKVKLFMPGFDVDSNANIPGIAPERDRISLNGEPIGFLDGENNQWVLNSFEVDVRKIKFASRGSNGSEPVGGVNQIRIDIDTANTQEAWCTSVDWGVGSFRAMSPIILIHGNNSTGAFFATQGFTAGLDARKLVYDNSINMASGGGAFIASNANDLNGRIPAIVRSYGAKTVHLVVHSKGGLDSRAYLANFQRRHQDEFKVISLTTLATPHNGSVLADLSIERLEASQQVGYTGSILYEGFPDYTRQLLAISQVMGIDDGRRNLTTGFVAGFNNRNLSRLDGLGVTFNTVTGDADLNSNGRIDRTPDEYAALRTESGLLRNAPDRTATFIVDSLYQILRKTRGVSVAYRDQCVTRFGPCRKIATVRSIDNAGLLGNDTLVTIPSGLGVGSIRSRTSNSQTFTGANGRNHSSIANRGIAQTVIPWLIDVDRRKGGLR